MRIPLDYIVAPVNVACCDIENVDSKGLGMHILFVYECKNYY